MSSLAQALKVEGDLPFGTQNPGSALGGMLFFLVFDIVLYPLFGALGGLITAKSHEGSPGLYRELIGVRQGPHS